jgi:hypothetical protein
MTLGIPWQTCHAPPETRPVNLVTNPSQGSRCGGRPAPIPTTCDGRNDPPGKRTAPDQVAFSVRKPLTGPPRRRTRSASSVRDRISNVPLEMQRSAPAIAGQEDRPFQARLSLSNSPKSRSPRRPVRADRYVRTNASRGA